MDGTETDAEVESVKGMDAAVVLLSTAEGTSRIHSSRRVFEVRGRGGLGGCR